LLSFSPKSFVFHLIPKHLKIKIYKTPLDCLADVLMGFHQHTSFKLNTEFNSDLAPCDFWAFLTMNRELQGKKF
jgi:hypothetical protein